MDLLEQLGLTKEELADRIVDRVSESMLSLGSDHDDSKFKRALQERIKKKIDEAVDTIAARHVIPNVESYVENLCLQTTNRWGEKVGEPMTFVEYLVSRAENYLTEQVDYSGKGKSEGSYNWSGTQTRITHLVHEHLHFSIQKAMTEAIKNANSAIVKGLEETVKLKLKEVSDSLRVGVQTK